MKISEILKHATGRIESSHTIADRAVHSVPTGGIADVSEARSFLHNFSLKASVALSPSDLLKLAADEAERRGL